MRQLLADRRRPDPLAGPAHGAGLGTRKAGQLIAAFRTPQAIFQASRSELEAAGLASAVAQSIASGCSFEDAVAQKEKLAQAGAELVPLTDPRYPLRLKEIFDPPPLLYARGRVELLANLMLGIVGTRPPPTESPPRPGFPRTWRRRV